MPRSAPGDAAAALHTVLGHARCPTLCESVLLMDFVPLRNGFCAGKRTFALTLQLVSLGREHTIARLLGRNAELIVPEACRDIVDVMMQCTVECAVRPSKKL